MRIKDILAAIGALIVATWPLWAWLICYLLGWQID